MEILISQLGKESALDYMNRLTEAGIPAEIRIRRDGSLRPRDTVFAYAILVDRQNYQKAESLLGFDVNTDGEILLGVPAELPERMLASADRSSNEEAWRIADFPGILDLATQHSLACIGGQFQFRGPLGIAEMFWLEAYSNPRESNESWSCYVARANSEVKVGFDKLVQDTNFDSEARGWNHIQKALEEGRITDPQKYLFFVANFSQKPEKTVLS